MICPLLKIQVPIGLIYTRPMDGLDHVENVSIQIDLFI